MENYNLLSELKNDLLFLKYPLVDSMGDDEILTLFDLSNSIYLVEWIIQELNKSCGGSLQNFEKNEELLKSLVCEMGICQKKESVPFMKGKLDLAKQYYIIKKLFLSLRRAAQSTPEVDVLYDNIVNLKIMNLNLFPMYGDIKCAGTEEYKIVENIIQSMTSKSKQVLYSDMMKHDVEVILMEIREHFPNIANKLQTLEQSHCMLTKNTIKIDADSPMILKKCDDYLKIISQFLQDVTVIRKFEEIDFTRSNTNYENTEWYSILKNICDQVEDVFKHSSVKNPNVIY